MVDEQVSQTEDSYQKVDDLSFNTIIMLQVKKICDLGSQDLVGGYTTQKNRVIGTLVVSEEEYVISARDAFCNAILMLNALAVHKYIPKYQTSINEQEEKNANVMLNYYAQWKLKTNEQFNYVIQIGGSQEDWYRRKVELFRELFEELCGFLNVSDSSTLGG